MEIDLTDKRLFYSFCQQRRQAAGRGIVFELTFKQWLRIWLRSGHLRERGRQLGQYVMARFRDRGPYAVGNVRIVTSSQNNSEKRMGAAALASMAATKRGVPGPFLGRLHSIETRARMSAAHLGHKHTAATRAKMSQRKRRKQDHGN